jgi:hypothetical protein
VAERSSGGASVVELSLAAAGGALLVVGFFWGRELARRRRSSSRPWAHRAPTAPAVPPAADPHTVEDARSSSIMKSELERLAGVAVSHGGDDPALDVFLAFVAALDPLPDAATLKPAAQRIGELRLEQALGRPGEPGLGARRLLAAAHRAIDDDAPEPARAVMTVTAERAGETTRGLPELVEALLQAIRGALGVLF